MNNNNPKNHKEMEKFFIQDNTIDWACLNVSALNLKSGNTEKVTTIPEHLRLKVSIMNVNPVTGVVSAEDSAFAMRHGKKRHLLLMRDGKVVGWAAFHRKERAYKVTVELRSEDEFEVKAKSPEDAYRKALAEAEKTYGNIFYEITDIEPAETEE